MRAIYPAHLVWLCYLLELTEIMLWLWELWVPAKRRRSDSKKRVKIIWQSGPERNDPVLQYSLEYRGKSLLIFTVCTLYLNNLTFFYYSGIITVTRIFKLFLSLVISYDIHRIPWKTLCHALQ
jgi:hypothetical protein